MTGRRQGIDSRDAFDITLVFDQRPYLQDGWLTWSVKDDGGAAIPGAGGVDTGAGWFTVVVQLGSEIATVDYLMADGRVVE